MKINGQQITKAFNINDKTQPFTEQIFNLLKDIETRNTNSLKSLVGKRVGIIRTGCGKATLVGLVTIADVIKYETEDAFRADEKRHMVKKGSKYDIKKGGVKYGYVLVDVERCDPVIIASKGIVIRNI